MMINVVKSEDVIQSSMMLNKDANFDIENDQISQSYNSVFLDDNIEVQDNANSPSKEVEDSQVLEECKFDDESVKYDNDLVLLEEGEELQSLGYIESNKQHSSFKSFMQSEHSK